jgi:hypothetical protein
VIPPEDPPLRAGSCSASASPRTSLVRE